MAPVVWVTIAVQLPGSDQQVRLNVTGRDVRQWESETQRSWFADPVMTATQAMDLAKIIARREGLWSGTDAEWEAGAIAWPTSPEVPADPTRPAPGDGVSSG
jgi:hypothetical protein